MLINIDNSLENDLLVYQTNKLIKMTAWIWIVTPSLVTMFSGMAVGSTTSIAIIDKFEGERGQSCAIYYVAIPSSVLMILSVIDHLIVSL